MAGPACLIPEQSIALYEAAREKRWDEALALQKKLWPLNVAFQRYSLAACVKAGLEMQGFAVGPPLPPQKQLDRQGREVVRKVQSELAPKLGLAQIIVDISSSGETLRKNNLRVITEILDSTTRLACNKIAYRTFEKEINDLLARLRGGLGKK